MDSQAVEKILDSLVYTVKFHVKSDDLSSSGKCSCMSYFKDSDSFEDHFMIVVLYSVLDYDSYLINNPNTLELWSKRIHEVMNILCNAFEWEE